MTATAAPKVKDQELMPRRLVESATVNAAADFVSSKSYKKESDKEKEVNDFINTFVCHLIFYAVFCISIVLHILFDLGFGTFVKNQFIKLIEITKDIFVVKKPAFA
tara:strand:- start:772 stop:1089 length:318 start_codon:yes stop_codon:yes gene_type:complete